MNGTRQHPSVWLADHVIFFGYRWLTWAIATLPWFWGTSSDTYIWALITGGLLNIPFTLFAQPYVRATRRTPTLLAFDVLVSMVLLYIAYQPSVGEANTWLFLPFAYSCVILPSLQFGWRGGLLAGLAFVTMDRLAQFSVQPFSNDLSDRQWLNLLAMMVIPPLFGACFSLVIERVRQWSARRRQQNHHQRNTSSSNLQQRNQLTDPLRFMPIERKLHSHSTDEFGERLLALQATRVRAVEPSVEELRRLLFTPFPSANMDLTEVIDLLVLRFEQHNGATSRVVTLGRPRKLHIAQQQVLIRLVQEVLLNVQQHAQATHLTCTLRYDVASVVLMLQDDGVGLQDGSYERPGLHALRAMHYRLAELGGRLDVFDTEHGGVTVRATLPLD